MNPNDDPNNQVPFDPNAQSSGNDDLFPGFLNDTGDNSVPDFLQGDQSQGDPSQGGGGQPQTQYVRAGSPESGVTIPIEVQSQGPESGMESREVQESATEDREQVENKEVKKVQDDKGEQSKKPVIPTPEEVDPVGPKLYGYMVPPKILKNFNLIRSQKLKGSPTQSKTWLYVLLDRILKMHNEEK